MAVVSTSYWASSVQALVNLGRKELAGAMGLRMPETLAEERTMWELLGTFVYYPYDASWSARLDQFRGSQPPNKAIVQAFVDEVINKGNFERACELATSDLDNQAARAGQSPGLAGLLDEIRGVRTGFPDIAVAIVSAVEAGDRVAVRWVARGTHRGPFRGWA